MYESSSLEENQRVYYAYVTQFRNIKITKRDLEICKKGNIV